MKKMFCILAAALLGGCATYPSVTVRGSRGSDGVPVGSCEIVNQGRTQARGQFRDGKMDGQWSFFDSRVKVAEVTYRQGTASGPYKTFFGSVAFPALAGKLESEGQLQGSKVMGRFRGYAKTGEIMSDATFAADGTVRPTVGPVELARRLAEADARFVQQEEAPVRSLFH